MIEVVVKNEVTDREEYLELAKRFASDSCCDAGCLGMRVLYQEEDPNHVIIVSRWEQKSDFEAHCTGSTFNKYIPLMSKYYKSGTDTFYEVAL